MVRNFIKIGKTTLIAKGGFQIDFRGCFLIKTSFNSYFLLSVPPSDQRRSHAIFNWLFSALFVKNWPFCDQNIDVFYWLILKLFRPFGFFDRFTNCNFFDENYQNTRKMWVFDVISCLFSETTSMEYYMKTNFKFSQKTKTVLIRFVNHQKGQILLLWIISNNEKEKEKKDTLAIIIHLIIHRYDNTIIQMTNFGQKLV